MKNIWILAILFLGSHAIAQGDIEKDLGDFNEIKVYDLINVELFPSHENRAVISGDNKDDVELINRNGSLRIKMRFGQNFEGNKTVVSLFYKGLEVIDANEGSYVSSEETFKQYTLELRVQEGAVIKVPLEVTDAKIKAVTGGEIEVVGTAVRQDISINTGGVFEGRNMETESTYITINAAGEGHINASRLADVKVRAGGDVYIYGHPEKVKETKFLGGRIQIVE